MLTRLRDRKNNPDHIILEDSIKRRVDVTIEGLTASFNTLYNPISLCNSGKGKDNVITICDYIDSLRAEVNAAVHYRRDVVLLLARFSIFHNNQKKFNEITRADILKFLDSFRKSEAIDPLHKWIGTYNIFRIHLIRFFRWLHSPDIEYNKRPRPSIIDNIPKLKRKEISIYKPTDLWIAEDHSLFLNYCPKSRDRCYHAMAHDSACRPSELLKLKIKDVVFKITPDKTKQYAEVQLSGKTGTRSVPLFNSIPYLKDWIEHQHPHGSNPNSILLCGLGKSLDDKALTVISLDTIYYRYKHYYFPSLLDNAIVSPEDKEKIRELLKKPWNPYIIRHSSLTEKSGILKEHHLRQYAGWTTSSQMPSKYIHYFGNESSESLLEAYGVVTKDKQSSDTLKPKQCPQCNEPNKPDSRFCAKCRMVLTYDAYNETMESQKQKDSEVQTLREQMKLLQESQKEILECLKYPEKLAQIAKEG